MLKLLISFAVLLFTAGCGPRYVDYFPYHDDGRSKPAVALFPLEDKSGHPVLLDLSQVVTERIRYDIMSSGELYLLSIEEIESSSAQPERLPLFERFPDTDFVVNCELIRAESVPFEAVPFQNKGLVIDYPCDTQLTFYVRLKVLDIRSRSPRVVLQEILTTSFLLPLDSTGRNDLGSPLWRAEQRLADGIAKRLEQVIRSAY